MLSVNPKIHLTNWLISFTKVQVFIGLPINPPVGISLISSMPSAITEAVTKTMGISPVSLSWRNILAALEPRIAAYP